MDEETKELFDQGESLLQAGKYEEAVERFDDVIKVEPNNPEVLLDRGFCLKELDRFEEAVECFSKTTKLN